MILVPLLIAGILLIAVFAMYNGLVGKKNAVENAACSKRSPNCAPAPSPAPRRRMNRSPSTTS